jgi:hypothetical protein
MLGVEEAEKAGEILYLRRALEDRTASVKGTRGHDIPTIRPWRPRNITARVRRDIHAGELEETFVPWSNLFLQ